MNDNLPDSFFEQDGLSKEALGKAAYEARFAGEPARCVTAWADLTEEAKAVWQRTAQGVLQHVGLVFLIEDVRAEMERANA